MISLFLDSSDKKVIVALLSGGKLIDSIIEENDNHLSEKFLPMIERIIAKNQLQIDELIPYATVQDLSLLEKIKKKCICWKLERILLLTGPVFMKIVRRAG